LGGETQRNQEIKGSLKHAKKILLPTKFDQNFGYMMHHLFKGSALAWGAIQISSYFP